MIEAIVFSRDRPAQLDLLLRSIKERASQLVNPIYVICHATNDAFKEGYAICENEHKNTCFTWNDDFREEVDVCLEDLGEYVCFLCDDDVVVRTAPDHGKPQGFLDNTNILCFSLRLGKNTTNCYPLRREQDTPMWPLEHHDVCVWSWPNADGDFSYPGSLDGHVFRRNMLRDMVGGELFTNPNQLEEILVDHCRCYLNEYPMMACYQSSLITGVPINRVTESYPNRAGDFYPQEPELLNATYLGGKRLMIPPEGTAITGAHTELPLVFE